MWLLPVYVTAVTAWVIAADYGVPHSLPLTVNGFLVGDKVIHFLVVGLFGLVLARTFWLIGCRPSRALIVGASVALLAASLEELTNLAKPGRTFSVADLLADLTGVIALAYLGWLAEFRYLPDRAPRLEGLPAVPPTQPLAGG